MGLDAAVGAGALEPARVGPALCDRSLLASEGARPTPASDPCGLGAADDEASAVGCPGELSSWLSMGAFRRCPWPWRACSTT
jgi:hypothetical protein